MINGTAFSPHLRVFLWRMLDSGQINGAGEKLWAQPVTATAQHLLLKSLFVKRAYLRPWAPFTLSLKRYVETYRKV